MKETPWISGPLFLGGFVPIVVALGVYIYFAIKDPDRLHSDDYQIRRSVLDMIDAKAGAFHVKDVELADIANPQPAAKKPALPPSTAPELAELEQLEGGRDD